jgi:heme exporter protein A
LSHPLLTLEAVGCERGYRQLFRNLSLELSAGEAVRVAGPNGSGKSTLLKVIAGISSHYTGRILWQGEETSRCREDFHAGMIFLGHARAVKTALTASENLEWFAGLYPCRTDVSITDALRHVGLAPFADTLCGQLSAGQQQRVALARLVLGAAALWILDEPFTAIDRDGVMQFEEMIGEFVRLGGTVIITTHHSLQLPVPVRTIDLGDYA